MTDPLHDDAVSRRYRELPPEEPPRSLDDAILAASRRSAGARRAPLVAPTGRQRWYVPLAAAAVIVLAAGLGLHLQLDQPPVEDVTPPGPAVLTAPAPKEQAKPKAAEGKPRVAQAAPATPAHKQTEEARRDSPPPFKDESLARTAPAAPSSNAAAAEPRAMAAPKPQAMRRAEQSVASGAVAKRAIEDTPEKALERIAELRKAGKDEEADRALAEFRKRYPDYRMSDEMKAKVERR